MFKCFPLPFCSRNLEQIDKRHCNLTSVPDDVLRYTRTLEELLLDANQLQDLPKGVYRLTQLRRLTFSDNEIQRILPEIGQLVNLEELDCSRNDIAEIPENIRHCRALQALDFSGNPLANNLPPGIIHLRQLTQLILNDVSLAELPREIGSLSNLRILEVRENLLKILPDSFVQLSKLESLDLGSNVIEHLPSHIGHLHALKELWLDANELLQLPEEIGQLKRLQCLDVSENKLTVLPREIGDLEALTSLELSSNQIEYLPETIGQLKQRLLILKINSNSLSQLCEEIGHCLGLTELILTENVLSELPKTIGNLKNLSNLNVDRNQLTQLPIEISGCESLGMLSLRDNRLTSIPSALSNLKHLHVLDLSGNRLSNLPCTLLDCDLKAIWLAENQAQPMLKFQTDIDANSGEKVLTCYLLPQQQYTSSSMENLLNSSRPPTETSTRAGVQSPRFEENDDETQHERTGSVKFADQAEDIRESSLQRHNTPHPKDLQSRRKKMANKLQNEENSSHPEQQQQPPARHSTTRTDSSHPSISSGNSQANKTHAETIPNSRHSLDYIPPDISYENHHDSDDNEPSGDHTVYIEKHVEFTDELHPNEEEKEPSEQQKLHRRDTPHHLKNKRVLNKNTDPVTFDHIISHSPTKSSISSSRKESIPTSTRALNSHQEEISVTLHRPSSTGLGISIAGGIGSIAYKANDYGIFLSKVTDEGPAGQAGLLVGDKLLSVNGESLVDCEHRHAVSALKTAGDTIEMVVIREASPATDESSVTNEDFVSKEVEKPNGQVDFSIVPSSSTSDHDRFSLSEEKKSSSAVGERLLRTNGHDQAVEMVNNVESTVYREKLANGNQTIVDNTIEEARIVKGSGPMGLSIVGGIDQACAPFGIDQRGVFVSKILPTGSASRTNLRIGDRILTVNNQDISQATHLEAVQALLQPANEVILLVRHEPQPAGLKEITLTRQSNEALGIRINGGIDGKRINPDDPEDDGIFVTEVKENTPASGLLAVGTRLLEVNNQSLFGAHLDDVQKWLSAPTDTLHLLICHGFQPREITSMSIPTYVVSPPPVPSRPLISPDLLSPTSSIKSNGISPRSTQPPPVPAKPKSRPSINGENQTNPLSPSQNGFDIDECDLSITESERSFKDKKKFFESGLQDPGPKPKPRQFKYINEHELIKMKQEDEQKVKTMSSTELLQSRTLFDQDKHDSDRFQTTLSQYQTPTYLAKPEEDDDDLIPQRPTRNLPSTTRLNALERDTASVHNMLSKIPLVDSGMT